jgi:hypothetical protein
MEQIDDAPERPVSVLATAIRASAGAGVPLNDQGRATNVRLQDIPSSLVRPAVSDDKAPIPRNGWIKIHRSFPIIARQPILIEGGATLLAVQFSEARSEGRALLKVMVAPCAFERLLGGGDKPVFFHCRPQSDQCTDVLAGVTCGSGGGAT